MVTDQDLQQLRKRLNNSELRSRFYTSISESHLYLSHQTMTQELSS